MDKTIFLKKKIFSLKYFIQSGLLFSFFYL